MAQTEKCRIVFMGSPLFAVYSLEQLAAWPPADIVAVYTQPDRPAGRGNRLRMSPVKEWALAHGLPVVQPESLKVAEEQRTLAAFAPDILVIAAYGMLLPEAVLRIPRFDCLNVHASLLPCYRGAAPIHRAVMDSWRPDWETGVCIMRVTPPLDSGPVFASVPVPVGEHTAGSLHDVLAVKGAQLLIQVLDGLRAGSLSPVKQDDQRVTYAAKVTRQDSVIDWKRPVVQVHAHIRGVTPRPGACVLLEPVDSSLSPVSLILGPGFLGGSNEGAIPGTVYRHAKGLRIACADAWYELHSVRPSGKRDMPVADALRGLLRQWPIGTCAHAVPCHA